MEYGNGKGKAGEEFGKDILFDDAAVGLASNIVHDSDPPVSWEFALHSVNERHRVILCLAGSLHVRIVKDMIMATHYRHESSVLKEGGRPFHAPLVSGFKGSLTAIESRIGDVHALLVAVLGRGER